MLAEIIPLFSGEVAEEISLLQMEQWLASPGFPDQPPAEIATILSRMREAPSARPQAAQADQKVIPFRRPSPAA